MFLFWLAAREKVRIQVVQAKTVQAKQFEQSLERARRRAPEWVLLAAKTLIFSVDALLAVACFVIAFKLREGETILSPTAWAWSKAFVPYAGVLFFVVPVRLAMLLYQRVYRLSGAFSYTGEIFKIFKAVLVGSLLIIAFTFLFRGGFAFRDFSYSRGVFVLDYFLALIAFATFHLAVRYTQTIFRRRGVNLIPTLVVGSGAEAEQTISELAVRSDLGYRVVGIVTNDESRILNAEPKENSAFSIQHPAFRNVPVVGNLKDLSNVIRRLAIQEVIITDNRIPSEKIFDAMMQIGRRQRVEFRFAPSLFNVLPQKTEVEQIGVLPMVRLFREPLSDAQRFLKRTFDIVISALALIIFSPVWLIVSILIKSDSRGSVLFKQERVGMDGRIFLCYKFRTMQADADEKVHREAYRKNIEGARAEANAGDDEKPVFGKVKNDRRVTNIGKILRRASLDELPQFLNVLRGEMSVVGARPPIPYEVEEYDLKHRRRLDMKPGITGLWQVSGRNRLTFEEMVKIDLYYIENWSPWLDLKIILLTIPAIFRGDGAR
ncbi:MAG: sugar transferase [Pyrinomonadaceae bacterium]